jgi:hypothetical protein
VLETDAKQVIRFGTFEVDPRAGEIGQRQNDSLANDEEPDLEFVCRALGEIGRSGDCAAICHKNGLST